MEYGGGQIASVAEVVCGSFMIGGRPQFGSPHGSASLQHIGLETQVVGELPGALVRRQVAVYLSACFKAVLIIRAIPIRTIMQSVPKSPLHALCTNECHPMLWTEPNEIPDDRFSVI